LSGLLRIRTRRRSGGGFDLDLGDYSEGVEDSLLEFADSFLMFNKVIDGVIEYWLID